MVSPDFFAVFGVSPIAGRLWQPSEDDVPLAVVSDQRAREWFGDPRAAVGSTLAILGPPLEIVGVAPPGFRYPGATDIRSDPRDAPAPRTR